MGLELILAVVAFVSAAATTAYQVIQAKKMKKQAQAAADARKGFEIVTEGEPGYLPIVYGRALIGGMRTWHGTASNFRFVTPNSDKSFLTGNPGGNSYSYTTRDWAEAFGRAAPVTVNVPAQAAGYMSGPLTGSRNEFLYYQQAICMGPINAVRDVIIDGGRYIDDPMLGSYGKIAATSTEKEKSGVKAALRLDYHYNGGFDSICATNFAVRKDAIFDKIAYLSAAFRLDRDEPQFQGVPAVQSLIEGRKVRWVEDGIISTTQSYEDAPTQYVYTTSGPLCLLDYMLDKESGGNYDLEDIDLASFEAAAAIGGSIVQSNVAVGGKFWKTTDGLYNISVRNLPLYECNIVIDTSKPVRENIEAILSTMGDTRLVWSGGKYRLNMQYPLTNEDIVIAHEINDDNLVLENEIQIAWPTAQDRFNHATVRFHNEYENFKEDSVSWPPKYNNTASIGIGAKNYSVGLGSWDDSKPGGRLLNQYNVWNGGGASTTMTWKLRVNPDQQGNYTISAAGDDNFNLTIKDETNATIATVSRGGNYNANHVGTAAVTLGHASEVKIYTITLTGQNTGNGGSKDYKGLAAKIENASTIIWTSRSTSYDSFSTVTNTNTVYQAMKTEDNGLELEADMFADGITDPQHALAKAEELVRTSRSATGYTFTYVIEDRFIDPGDFIRFRSEELNIGVIEPLYLRVEDVKVTDEDKCELTTSRFDYTQLAWANKDDVYINPPPIYASFIPQPYEIIYAPPTQAEIQSSGKLTASPVGISDLAGYVWFVWRTGVDPVDEYNQPIYSEIGRTTEPVFQLPAINAASAFFGVKTLTTSGAMSRITTTAITAAIDLEHTWTKNVELSASDQVFKKIANVAVPANIIIAAVTTGFNDPEYKWYIDGVLQAGETDDIFVIEHFDNVSSKKIAVDVNETGEVLIYHADMFIVYTEDGTYGAPPGTPVGTTTAEAIQETVEGLLETYGDTASSEASAAAAAASALAAQTAEDNAQLSETNSAGHASTASTKAGEASGSATAAQGYASTASSAAGTATTQAGIAGGHAATAGSQASSATTQANLSATYATQSRLQAARTLPSTFENKGQFFFLGYDGEPKDATPIADVFGAGIFTDVAGVGRVIQLNAVAGGSTDVSNIGVLPVEAGRTYKATIRFRSLSGTAPVTLYLITLNASHAFVGVAGNNASPTATTAWQTASVTVSGDTMLAAGAVYIRTLFRVGVSANQVQASIVRIEDVTESLTATTQAGIATSQAAIATSASSAATTSQNLTAAYSGPRGLTPNFDLKSGTTLWYGTWTGVSAPSNGAWAAVDGGALGVWYNNAGVGSNIYSSLMPIDPVTRKYKIKGRVWSYGPAAGGIYIGATSHDANGNAIGLNAGHNYILGWSNATKATGWHDIESEVLTGVGASADLASWFRAGTKQVRLCAFLNYANTGSQYWVLDSLWLEDVTDSEAALDSAGVATTQAGVATSQAAVATSAAAAAQTSMELTSSVNNAYMTKNTGFDNYPSNATGAVPAYWYAGTGTHLSYRVADVMGGYAWRMLGVAGADTYGYTNYYASPVFKQGDYVVMDAEVVLNSGSFAGAGVLVYGLNAGGSVMESHIIQFTADKDSSNQVIGAGVVGRTYRFTKMRRISHADSIGFQIYAMSHWTSLGSTAAANDITWNKCGLRFATEAEIAAGVALPDLSASVSTIASTLSTHTSQLASYLLRTAAGAGSATIEMVAQDSGGSPASSITFKASRIQIGSNIAVDSVGGVTTFTGEANFGVASGARTNLTSAGMKVHDGTIARVKIGNLAVL